MARVIMHLDLDAFFCAVEELRDPSLRGRAFAVGGSPEGRGVVASCSYAAREYGIHSAMPMAQAVRRCPNLIVVRSNFKSYGHYSRQVMERLRALTPLVEKLSIDEAFLDVTGIRDEPEVIARRLQKQINDELNLPCSLGVASNKLVAKTANNIGKAQARGGSTPNAITIVPPGSEADFLAPLPVRELWGVGPKTADKLRMLGIETIGDVARWPAADLIRRFGKHGADIHRRAQGIDNRPVETEHESKSISKETTFSRDINNRDELLQTLRRLADGVGRQLRKEGLAGTTVKLKLRWPDFTTITRQITLPQPVSTDDEIYAAAADIFATAWPRHQYVRLIGVGVSGLDTARRQLSLWDAQNEQQEQQLQQTLDDLRDRFGDGTITRGSHFRPDRQ
jgi:DNA polymerase-4